MVVGIELIWLIEYTGSFEFLRNLPGVRVSLPRVVSIYCSLLKDRLTSSGTIVETSKTGEPFCPRPITLVLNSHIKQGQKIDVPRGEDFLQF